MSSTSENPEASSEDDMRELTASIPEDDAGAANEDRLAKALSQRDTLREQRDKVREQRDKIREQRDAYREQRDACRNEIAELKAHLEEVVNEAEAEREASRSVSDLNDLSSAKHGDPSRYAALLKRELLAETARVQALERNLDRALRRNSELEANLSKTRAMLAVAIDDGPLDPAALKAELATNSAGSTVALSHALLATLNQMPQSGVEPSVGSRNDGPMAAPIDEAPDVTDDARPAPGEEVETEEAVSPPEAEPEADDPDVVDDARPAPGSSAFNVVSEDLRAVDAPAQDRILARLPEPAVLKGKLLSPNRAAKVTEERQLQIDAFIADGEYARIQDLKDIHKGRRAFIIGNGPSLAQQDLSKLDGEITFVANWFANHDGFDQIKPRYYAISSHEMFGGWASENPTLNESFVEKLTRHAHKPEMFFSHRFREALRNEVALEDYERRFLIFDRPKFLADEVGGLEFDLAQPMHDGYTVLLTFCVPLAIHMGITEIYMVGCDCDYAIQTNSDARAYFYAATEHATSSTKAENINRIWAENGPLFRVYELTRDDCAARGVQMVNATAGGKLEVLPRANYDEILSVPPMAAWA